MSNITASLTHRELTGETILPKGNDGPDVWTFPESANRRLLVGVAGSPRALKEVLRLRSMVFNLELGHGTDTAKQEGVDRDAFDAQMDHLVLMERDTGEIVGTYRVQTVETALASRGIYSAQEYELAALEPYYPQAVECGRACIVKRYRQATSLLLLWAGLRAYLKRTRKRWLFGCCSINSQDTDEGWRTMKELRRRGYLHHSLCLTPTRSCSCGEPAREFAPALGSPLKLPKLFGAYMRLGAKAISLPAIDRQFGTIDFLVMADSHHVNMSSMNL